MQISPIKKNPTKLPQRQMQIKVYKHSRIHLWRYFFMLFGLRACKCAHVSGTAEYF